MEGGQGIDGSEERRRRGDGVGAGVDGIGLGARNNRTGWDRGRHRGGGVPGSQRLQWSEVEQSGAEWRSDLSGRDTKKIMTKVVTINLLRDRVQSSL